MSVKTVILGPRSPELEALIERRRALGQDLYDEVWEGEYHMAPAAHSRHGILDQQLAVILDPHIRRAGLIGTGALNLGEKDNFRVSDRAVHRQPPHGTFASTAAVVVEILSDHDETFEKFGFYAAHGVEELLVVDPRHRSVLCWHLVDGDYTPRPGSVVLDLSCDQITRQVDWPQVED